ncbi:MAG TPA: hypothetical protein VMH40_22165 [Myxococcaceae bacterium]|nr:hypothetical protein [Myxococcaceae bacterium]
MGEFVITKLEKGAWEPSLLDEMARLVGPSTGPIPPVLEAELLRGDRLYLARDAQGLVAFLVVARVRLPVGPERRHGRYLGLSAVRQDQRGVGAAEALHAHFIADAQAEERRLRQRLVLFSAATTPRALRTARAFWGNVQPAHDSSFPAELLPVACAAAHWLGARPSPELPFVLPGSGNTARPWPGAARVDGETDGVDLFRRLGVEAINGDRLLVFYSLPQSGVSSSTAAEAAA